MKRCLKKILLMVLCVTTVLSAVPANAAGIDVDDYKPDPYYTAWSTTDECIEFPRSGEYLSNPYVASVYAIQRQISIYLMPMPEKGHGNLGTVGHGKKVLILAKSGGFLFFLTQDGRYGWNGSKYFDKVSNSSSYMHLFPTNGGSSVGILTEEEEGRAVPIDTSGSKKQLADGKHYVRLVKAWETNGTEKVKVEKLKVKSYDRNGEPVFKGTGKYYSYNLKDCKIYDDDILSINPYGYKYGERVYSIDDILCRYGYCDVQITIEDGKVIRMIRQFHTP